MSKLLWKKRCKKRKTLVSVISRWETLIPLYAIEHHHFTQECDTYKDFYSAWHRSPDSKFEVWGMVVGTKFRTRAGAERACQQHFSAAQRAEEKKHAPRKKVAAAKPRRNSGRARTTDHQPPQS